MGRRLDKSNAIDVEPGLNGTFEPKAEEKIAMSVGHNDGKVFLDFGKRPICWLNFTPEQARQVAHSLLNAAAACTMGGHNVIKP